MRSVALRFQALSGATLSSSRRRVAPLRSCTEPSGDVNPRTRRTYSAGSCWQSMYCMEVTVQVPRLLWLISPGWPASSITDSRMSPREMPLAAREGASGPVAMACRLSSRVVPSLSLSSRAVRCSIFTPPPKIPPGPKEMCGRVRWVRATRFSRPA